MIPKECRRRAVWHSLATLNDACPGKNDDTTFCRRRGSRMSGDRKDGLEVKYAED
jgi:hypothetical protein